MHRFLTRAVLWSALVRSESLAKEGRALGRLGRSGFIVTPVSLRARVGSSSLKQIFQTVKSRRRRYREDALLRTVLLRLLSQLAGAPVSMIITHSLANRLAPTELALVWVMASRAFSFFPTNLANEAQLKRYP